MYDITIRFKDELMCIIDCDKAIGYGIKDRFCFMKKGYQYSPAYKYGGWDGKISMINLKTREFYVGLIPDLFKWAKEKSYTIGFNEDEKYLFKPFIKFDPKYFTDVVPKICKFTPKDYQYKYVEEGLKWNKLLILSPTGSGKSLTIFLLIRYILMETDFKILITVPSISLVEQLYQDFIDYTIDDWDVSNEVTKVHSKAIENPNARVVISTWQTCAKKDSKYFQQFDAYLCDEAHSASAAETTKIINNLSHAKFRFGLTGTLDGTDLHELEMIGRFGRLYRVVSTADLMKSSDLAQLKVNFLKIKYPLTECKLITKKSTEYQQEIKYITEHEGRNKLLVKLGVNQNKNALMLFNYVEGHGKVLYEMMKDQCADRGKKLFYISGETKPMDRERIRHEMEKSGNTLIGYDVKINGVNYCIKSGTLIALESGEQKTINELTKDDDICETWFEQNKANFQNFR